VASRRPSSAFKEEATAEVTAGGRLALEDFPARAKSPELEQLEADPARLDAE